MKCFLATVFLSLIVATANAAFITYDVNRTIGDGTVTGFIETDGTIGILSETNIKDWSLTLIAPNLNGGLPDPTSDVISFNQSGSDTILRGTAIRATETQLLFNFDAAGTSYLFLSGNSTNFWCLETRICIDDGIDKAEEIGHNNNGTKVAQLENFTGEVAFATATVIPVPAAVWLFCSGLIGLVGFARRKR